MKLVTNLVCRWLLFGPPFLFWLYILVPDEKMALKKSEFCFRYFQVYRVARVIDFVYNGFVFFFENGCFYQSNP